MDLSRTTTAELVALAATDGSMADAAWRVFLERHRGVIKAVAMRAGLREHAAEDVAQETAMECWQAVRHGRYRRERGRLRTFLLTIARNRTIDRRRQQLRAPRSAPSGELREVASSADEFEALFEDECRKRLIEEALALLANHCGFTEETLLAFERVHVDGDAPSDVARDLGVKVQVVGTTRRRAVVLACRSSSPSFDVIIRSMAEDFDTTGGEDEPTDDLLADLKRHDLRPTAYRHRPVLPRRFAVSREIRRGGQAIVYDATDGSSGRRVALKVWLRREPDEDRRRFEREVRVLTRLSHPSIAEVLDSGEVDGWRWCAIDYIDGRDVSRWAEEVDRQPEVVVALLVDVCDAVAISHDHGIVHRDLKPSNVLVDQTGRPVVLDFGLAKRFGDASSMSAEITTSGVVVGTLVWLAPEQVTSPSEVGPATDVHALGHLAFHMLSGGHPHPGDPGRYEWIQRLVDEEPASLRDRPGARRVDAALAAIVMRACARRPGDRHADAAALRDDLLRWTSTEHADRATGWLARLRRWLALDE